MRVNKFRESSVDSSNFFVGELVLYYLNCSISRSTSSPYLYAISNCHYRLSTIFCSTEISWSYCCILDFNYNDSESCLIAFNSLTAIEFSVFGIVLLRCEGTSVRVTMHWEITYDGSNRSSVVYLALKSGISRYIIRSTCACERSKRAFSRAL